MGEQVDSFIKFNTEAGLTIWCKVDGEHLPALR